MTKIILLYIVCFAFSISSQRWERLKDFEDLHQIYAFMLTDWKKLKGNCSLVLGRFSQAIRLLYIPYRSCLSAFYIWEAIVFKASRNVNKPEIFPFNECNTCLVKHILQISALNILYNTIDFDMYTFTIQYSSVVWAVCVSSKKELFLFICSSFDYSVNSLCLSFI